MKLTPLSTGRPSDWGASSPRRGVACIRSRAGRCWWSIPRHRPRGRRADGSAPLDLGWAGEGRPSGTRCVHHGQLGGRRSRQGLALAIGRGDAVAAYRPHTPKTWVGEQTGRAKRLACLARRRPSASQCGQRAAIVHRAVCDLAFGVRTQRSALARTPERRLPRREPSPDRSMRQPPAARGRCASHTKRLVLHQQDA
jgi:hypothetical protein